MCAQFSRALPDTYTPTSTRRNRKPLTLVLEFPAITRSMARSPKIPRFHECEPPVISSSRGKEHLAPARFRAGPTPHRTATCCIPLVFSSVVFQLQVDTTTNRVSRVSGQQPALGDTLPFPAIADLYHDHTSYSRSQASPTVVCCGPSSTTPFTGSHLLGRPWAVFSRSRQNNYCRHIEDCTVPFGSRRSPSTCAGCRPVAVILLHVPASPSDIYKVPVSVLPPQLQLKPALLDCPPCSLHPLPDSVLSHLLLIQ